MSAETDRAYRLLVESIPKIRSRMDGGHDSALDARDFAADAYTAAIALAREGEQARIVLAVGEVITTSESENMEDAAWGAGFLMQVLAAAVVQLEGSR